MSSYQHTNYTQSIDPRMTYANPPPLLRSQTPAPPPPPRTYTPAPPPRSHTPGPGPVPASRTRTAPPPVPCPICYDPAPPKRRQGQVSGMSVCDACAKYEARTGRQRPADVQARRGTTPTPRTAHLEREQQAERYNPMGTSKGVISFNNRRGQDPVARPSTCPPSRFPIVEDHPPLPPLPAYTTSATGALPPNSRPWIVATPPSQGVVNISGTSIPDRPASGICPNCWAPNVPAWRWGPVSQKMVCHPCGVYENRRGKVRPIELQLQMVERMEAGGLR